MRCVAVAHQVYFNKKRHANSKKKHLRKNAAGSASLRSSGAVRHLLVALHYLHSRGVSHGDVHIENAMVSGSQVICLLFY